MNKLIKNNPFLSKTFTHIWLKHFKKDSVLINLDKGLNVLLLKHKHFPYYYNVAKNFTNGISYIINPNNISFFFNKTILLYDVPNYFKNITPIGERIKIKKVNQYNGVFTNLEDYENIEIFLKSNFKSKKRSELIKFKKRLELCYNIEYLFYSGEIDKGEYEMLFNEFYLLLKKRYDSKKLNNRNLNKDFKDYYYDLIYSLILKREALFFVLKANGKPISMSLSFLSDDVLFYAIPVFDIDFTKFNLGHISIMSLLDWCIKNHITIFDFSKGEGIYKDKWINYSYKFENHIIFDSKNYFSIFMSNFLFYYFKIKQVLREININSKMQKLIFKLNYKEFDYKNYKVSDYKYKENEFKELINYAFENTTLNKALNEFLYINLANFYETKIYENISNQNLYIFNYNNNFQSIIIY